MQEIAGYDIPELNSEDFSEDDAVEILADVLYDEYVGYMQGHVSSSIIVKIMCYNHHIFQSKEKI